MRTHLRTLVVVFGTCVVGVLAPSIPELIAPANIRVFSGVFGVVVTLVAVFYGRLSAVTGAGLLKAKELERYTFAREDVRNRIAIVLGFSAIVTIFMWLLSKVPFGTPPIWLGYAVGFCLAVGIAYCLTVSRWILDLSSFEDGMRLRDEERKRSEATWKRLADAKK